MESEHQVTRGTRLPIEVDERIKKIIQRDGSTISQFLRTAAMEKLRRAEKVSRG